jgi:hypothetical protein
MRTHLHQALPALAVIFDADLNAYEAALSEGWPVHWEGVRRKTHAPTVEPSSAFQQRTLLRRDALPNRIGIRDALADEYIRGMAHTNTIEGFFRSSNAA